MSPSRTAAAEGLAGDDAHAPRRASGRRVVLWTTLGLLTMALLSTLIWARNIGMAEDWHMVPAMLGQQENLLAWIWSQNNEHRLPVQRMIYLALLWLTGDFRSGMIFNQIALAVVAWMLARAAAAARGDELRVTDALFPLALLHLGHWENLVWGWQIQFVWSIVLIGVLTVLVASRPGPLTPRWGVWAALLLVLLPFSGANGIAVGVAMAGWIAAHALVHLLSPGAAERWFGVAPGEQVPLRGAGLLLGAAGTLFAATIYFIGYEAPSWSPPLATFDQFLVAVQAYFSFALGPGARFLQSPAFLFVVIYMAAGGVLTVRAILFGDPSERLRATGLGLLVFSGLALGVAIALARGGYSYRMPDRYAHFSVMPLLAAAIAMRLYAPEPLGRWAISALVTAFLLMMPLNLRAGMYWRDWYVHGMREVEADIAAGQPVEEIAADNYEFLLHWNEQQLREGIVMLREAGVGPFAALQ